MTEQRHRQQDQESIQGPGWILAGAVVLVLLCWAAPTLVVLVTQRHLPHLGAISATTSALRLVGEGHWTDPAAAYPRVVQHDLPGATAYWALTLGFLTVAVGGLLLIARCVEPEIARSRLGRRAYEWRGARPRTWARPRDLRRPRNAPKGFSLGRLDGRDIYADEEAHVAVIAPTRAGKTTRCVIPWLLEHRGPAIVTSTKRDVVDAARAAREEQGHIWVFDPFSSDSATWSPSAGCEDWSQALRRAQWLADASADGDSEIARYWRGEAAKLLAPLLHAAALDGEPMTTVLAWLDTKEFYVPNRILGAEGAIAARQQLRAVSELDPRNKGTTYMSAGSVLAAYRYPELQTPAGPVLDVRRFLEYAGDTLFLVAPERHQQLLAPLLVALVSALVHEAIESSSFLEPGRRLRLLLDEAANVAPLADLPRVLSQAAGHGLRVATIWQSIAQLRGRYADEADTVLANSTAKLFLGPITDEATRRALVGLLGLDASRGRSPTLESAAAALQQLGGERALLVCGSQLPALVRLQPFWER
ncbi:MAG TPA: type IV secretory system conjugative DNA transfer family protein [Solirubrobacteraceae bacterium]|nr:type IV secretory system conjugative DNA transfer family protein [Solirubrobacteraceae bacterium]